VLGLVSIDESGQRLQPPIVFELQTEGVVYPRAHGRDLATLRSGLGSSEKIRVD